MTMRRREFIAGLGSAAAWPVVAGAQQGDRLRRIGILLTGEESDPQTQTDEAIFREALLKLGWIEGRNVRIDVRLGARDAKRIHDVAMELVSVAPEVIVTGGGPAIGELQRRTQTIPIVFTGGPDPLALGLMRNIARPEGNITGFPTVEPSTFGKWIELLKETAPHLARVCVVLTPQTLQLPDYFEATLTSYIEPTAATLGVDVIRTSVRNRGERIPVRRWAGETFAQPGRRGRQHWVQHISFERTADGVSVRSYWKVVQGLASRNTRTLNAVGFYDDFCVKFDGRWLIKEKRIHRCDDETPLPW